MDTISKIDRPDIGVALARVRSDVFWSESGISRTQRERRNGHRSCVIWLTGLSNAGKSTIALGLENELFARGHQVVVLDGDNVRHGLNADLGFSREDRRENIRRIGEVSNLFMQAGVIAIAAFISPYAIDREVVRKLVSENDFLEIHIDCPLAECERRDSKGLYEKARAGIITGFTGIDDPYEPPDRPRLRIDTLKHSVEQSVDIILTRLQADGYLRAHRASSGRSASAVTTPRSYPVLH